ncbi:MAG: MATE family efflux transporter [Firmicutes bacterium]|nr:MATE family efflux transporter [Bacillota bacterium]
MKNKTIDMTEGTPLKLLVVFTIPMILGNVFQQLYTMVDTMVVGRFVSKDALAAVGATGAIMFLMISVIIGFTVGTAIVTAQNAGAKNTKGIRSIVSTGFYIVVIEAIALTVIGNIGIRPALKLLNTPGEILNQADLYLRINFCTCIAPILYNIVSQFMRSLGDSKTPLYALIISSLTNIVLDLVFVIYFHMGVAGVAIATAIAQALSAIYCLVVTYTRFPEYIPQKGEWKVDSKIFKTILKFGIPMSLQNMLVSFGMMFVQSTINSFGTNIVAGYTAGNKVDQIGIQFMNSLGTAVSTYIGQNFGAKKIQRIFDGLKASLLLNVLMAIFLAVVIVCFSKYFVLLFMESKEVEAISVAVRYLVIVSTFYVFCGISQTFQNLLRGVNYVAVPTISSIIELVVKIGISFLFAKQFGYNGIWWAWPISWIVTDVFLFLYYRMKAYPALRKEL